MASATALATTSLAFALIPATTAAGDGPPATTVQMSVSTGGFAPGSGNNGGGRHTERRLVSADGRFVTFESSGQIVPGQGALNWQIVQRDRQLGTTTLISQSSTGEKGNDRSNDPSMSDDGRFVSFTSSATNLVPGDTNNQSDIFVRDTHTGTTTRVSVDSAGNQGSDTHSYGSSPSSISATGRYVSFLSYAGGLAPGDYQDGSDAYLHDRATGQTELVSLGTDSLRRSAMTATTVSADGTRVLFMSLDADVAPGAHNLDVDIFLRDRAAGTTRMIAGNQDGATYGTISADGSVAAYQTGESGIDPADTNNHKDVYVVDLTTGTHTVVSKNTAGAVGDGESLYPAMSSDGRYVVFESAATNLVAGDTNGEHDIFRHDRQTGETTRVGLIDNGTQNGSSSSSPAISADGQHVYFESHGREVTQVPTGTWGQAYVRDLTGRWPALHARTSVLPRRVQPKSNYAVSTYDIHAGAALELTWTPQAKTKGGVIQATVAVVNGSFTLRSPRRFGKYSVLVSYAGNTLAERTVAVVKPSAKKLQRKVKKGKLLTIKTVGVAKGQRVQVRWVPRGKTGGKTVNRKGKANKRGLVKVKTPTRKGVYKVIVRSKGQILRKGIVRVR